MIRTILVVSLFGFFYTVNAQQAPIAIVSSNGTTRLTSSLDSAALLADNNDIIYLPGGNLMGMSISFDNKVTLIGVGHNPDSTRATNSTYINGEIYMSYGAEGSIIDGIYLNGHLRLVNDCRIYRTNMENAFCITGWNGSGYSGSVTGYYFEQCVFRTGIVYQNGQVHYFGSGYFKNCVVAGDFVTYTNNNEFANCVFLATGTIGLYDLNTYINSTFTEVNDWGFTIQNCTFQKCIFNTSTLPPLSNPGNSFGNFFSQTTNQTFSDTLSINYQYTNDYIIKFTSPGHNSGTDGKDVGIYGGTSPWIKGNIPPNPHIRMKNVDAATGAGGTLRVRFNVGAQ